MGPRIRPEPVNTRYVHYGPSILDDTVKESSGRIFALVNNAGIYNGDVLNETNTEEWETTLGLHLTAPFYLVRNVHSIIEDRGSVVNISSVYGFRADA